MLYSLDVGVSPCPRCTATCSAANRLFHQLRSAIESAGIDNLEKWHRPDKKPLLARRAVYQYRSADASRKFWRPILEQAVRDWRG